MALSVRALQEKSTSSPNRAEPPRATTNIPEPKQQPFNNAFAGLKQRR
jgi:hypothetical protein